MACPESINALRRCCLAALLGWHAAGQATSAVSNAAAMAASGAAGSEAGLRQALLAATWPGDLVRLADDYLRQFPQHPDAAAAADIRRRAAVTARLLHTGEVQLFRPAFALPSGQGLPAEELRQAALGDAAAAWRLARQMRETPGTASAQIGWLQLASALGHERAAYELALHFRRQAQPLLASIYEQRALALGHSAPAALDHARK